jgi:hypothetical protein
MLQAFNKWSAAIFCFAAFFSLEAKVAAKFESLSGTVQYREKKGKWQDARIGTSLNTNTELQTGPTGKATLIFPNGNKVTLNPGTLASIDQYGSGAYGTQTNMSLRLGRMNADIAKVNDVNKRNHFRVRTPTVVAGTRGTVQEVGYTPDKGSDVKLVESSAEVTDKSGRTSVVPQGGQSTVTTGGTTTADKQETKNNTTTMSGQSASTAEAEVSLNAGDALFSANASDFDSVLGVLELLEAQEFGYGDPVLFDKL